MRIKSLLLAAVLVAAPLTGAPQDAGPTGVFAVDSDASWIRVLAWPAGPLKRFGHHHVISHRAISGTATVGADPLDTQFELALEVTSLDVDNADERAQEGEEFEGVVPQKDIDGTRENMLGEKLLNGEAFPTVLVRSQSIEGSLESATIVTTMTVKGVDMTVTVPASIELTADRFVARGEFEITHGALGLSQFTAMGGALSVRDLLVLKFEISGVLQPD
ncbi:MAG: YceI family protein [Pseudomonadota bacterium]